MNIGSLHFHLCFFPIRRMDEDMLQSPVGEINFVCRNIDAASKLRMLLCVMFSEGLGKYLEEMANIYSLHGDGLAIVMVNCVAATLEFSYVLRANSIDHEISTNLYNVIVARSCKLGFSFCM